ncbi:hypothetical protein CR492_00140 [Methylocella silvestris]|uniref:Uncharacterized protein n=1 Tax=Methylocella silvestris TaxID=199596 RepID=A0A2J7TKV2_METSI|nr:hypothetical protein CR492_00140 [Methylocella silvestris]
MALKLRQRLDPCRRAEGRTVERGNYSKTFITRQCFCIMRKLWASTACSDNGERPDAKIARPRPP